MYAFPQFLFWRLLWKNLFVIFVTVLLLLISFGSIDTSLHFNLRDGARVASSALSFQEFNCCWIALTASQISLRLELAFPRWSSLFREQAELYCAEKIDMNLKRRVYSAMGLRLQYDSFGKTKWMNSSWILARSKQTRRRYCRVHHRHPGRLSSVPWLAGNLPYWFGRHRRYPGIQKFLRLRAR